MGAGKHDLEAQHRKLAERYALDNPAGVKRLLRDYHALVKRQYDGDYSACDILTDLATAIAKAGLTGRQRQALRLVYVEDLTQEEAGRRLGVRQATINRYIYIAAVKIARVFEFWARHGEGYAITKEDEIYDNDKRAV